MALIPLQLSEEDLEIAERACRALAFRYEEDAARQGNPSIRERKLAAAQHMREIAARLRDARGAAG